MIQNSHVTKKTLDIDSGVFGVQKKTANKSISSLFLINISITIYM